MPAIIRNVVDLPQPDGPSKQVTCPGMIDNDTSSTTRRPPKLRTKLRISRRGCRGDVSLTIAGP
jgi:hypothetical protein